MNAYDQPAVELGKQAAHGLLGRKGEPYEQLADKVNAAQAGETEFVV